MKIIVGHRIGQRVPPVAGARTFLSALTPGEVVRARGRQECRRSNARHSSFSKAFTMIEIALALAVIAFALIAIIGVLPMGLNTQKDNREETIIAHDGQYFLEAIRSGARGMDHLTNHVISIEVSNSRNNNRLLFTNAPGVPAPYNLTNGLRVIGGLSYPRFTEAGDGGTITNYVRAQVRALSGAAVEQAGRYNDFSFHYVIQPEIIPFPGSPVVDRQSTNYAGLPEGDERTARSNRWFQVENRAMNMWEVRLHFEWPLLANGKTGPGRKTFRTLVSGQSLDSGGLRFIQPQVHSMIQGTMPTATEDEN
jgi:type II secretory pathway pseudopilin PulG